jgi:uncharacterized membrane protein
MLSSVAVLTLAVVALVGRRTCSRTTRQRQTEYATVRTLVQTYCLTCHSTKTAGASIWGGSPRSTTLGETSRCGRA